MHLIHTVVACLSLTVALTAEAPVEEGFEALFDGKSLKGWHVSAKSGHSGTSKHQSGGRWVVGGLAS